MLTRCWYCLRPLGLFKSLKQELFCDVEHERLYHSEQFHRAHDPFDAPTSPAMDEPAGPLADPEAEQHPAEVPQPQGLKGRR
ncbi:MAG TPA: hypothetical protein VKR43_14665 [Bryobacteraceae bacterium]|nr:hypothetical protein [Bryobacteraceae bacterium]